MKTKRDKERRNSQFDKPKYEELYEIAATRRKSEARMSFLENQYYLFNYIEVVIFNQLLIIINQQEIHLKYLFIYFIRLELKRNLKKIKRFMKNYRKNYQKKRILEQEKKKKNIKNALLNHK